MSHFQLDLFQALGERVNAEPERFRPLGDCDMVAALVCRRAAGDLAVRIEFEALRCTGVDAIDANDPAQLATADFSLDGPEAAWDAMFADIIANGSASGRQTINSLALLGTDIRLRGADPMGVDKFSRFNQTLQEYLDGTARLALRS
jgi:sirohydrochlorin ferrochelatase